MITVSTQQRLLSIQDSPIDKVGLALDLASAMKSAPRRSVECYVFPVRETPGSNERASGPARQKINITIGVVIGISANNDPSGERSVDELESVKNAVKDALFGWTPDGAKTRFLLGESKLVRMVPGGIWWLEQFTTTTQKTGKQNG